MTNHYGVIKQVMLSNRERVGKGLELLSQGLYPYVEQQLQEAYPDDWETQAKKELPDYKSTKKKDIKEWLSKDTGALLTVISKKWDDVFQKSIDKPEKRIVEELIETRNYWAHGDEFSADDTYSAINGMVRLLKAVKADEEIIKKVEKHKQEVLRILVQEQNRQENWQTKAAEARIISKLSGLLEQLPFQDASLLQDALTHRSYLYENPKEAKTDNELLEFLGDAVLNFLSGEYLYEKYKEEKDEGDLTRLRSALVEDKQLAKFAEQLELGKWMRLGKGAIADGAKDNLSVLSNTFEAIIGAYFLDSQMNAVRDFVRSLFDSVIEEIIAVSPQIDDYQTDTPQIAIDPKNQLQQWVQKNQGAILPQYRVIKEEGLPHDKTFTVQVSINGKVYAQGTGSTKKEAEKQAAGNALKKLGLL
ncbi:MULTISPECIES: ribonuclease III [Planktothricoides]|nr:MULTISPECIES: ribonuclease III [Planktothricoides]KOR37450.1 ribonuclease III [Planktothricoides sp. SR001]